MRLLADLELFAEVAKQRSFSRAAVALGMTPPTLTRRIAALEKEAGTTLIRRSTRSFALTLAGERLYERAQNILEEAVRAQEELLANANRIAGHLRVGAPADLMCTLLTPALAQYCRNNADISLSVKSTQGQPDLVRDALDVAFVVAHQTRLPNSSYATHAIGTFRRMLYASQGYLDQHGTPGREPQDLQHHSCIQHLNEAAAEAHWELHCGSSKRRQTIPITGTCACTSVIVCAQAAREHLGIAMLPQHLATHPAFGAGLQRILPEWEGTPAHVLAITPDRTVPARTREVLRILRQNFTSQLAQLERIHKEEPSFKTDSAGSLPKRNKIRNRTML